jgi:CMP-N-acetylneuraminic acid synthetase
VEDGMHKILGVYGTFNILGIIQARGGSKGIPKKNIKKINGKPLIVYTIEEGLDTFIFNDFVVSSDDDDILKVAEENNAYPLKRPEEFARDETLSVESLQWATLECEEAFNKKYDYVVELPCVCPLRKSIHIIEAVSKLIKTNADSVISVTQMQDKHPVRMKRIVDDQIKDFCSEYPEGDAGRRQDLEPCYIRNGGIYSMKRDTLISDYTRHGKDSRPYIMDEIHSVNIDSEIDLKLAEVLLKYES